MFSNPSVRDMMTYVLKTIANLCVDRIDTGSIIVSYFSLTVLHMTITNPKIINSCYSAAKNYQCLVLISYLF